MWRLGRATSPCSPRSCRRGRAPDHYKARLAGIEGLSHVSIEVNPYGAFRRRGQRRQCHPEPGCRGACADRLKTCLLGAAASRTSDALASQPPRTPSFPRVTSGGEPVSRPPHRRELPVPRCQAAVAPPNHAIAVHGAAPQRTILRPALRIRERPLKKRLVTHL